MKKALFTLALTAVAASSSFAQGYVSFNNGTATPVKANATIDGTSFASLPVSSTYYFALFYSATQTTVNGSTAAVVGGIANGNNTSSAFVLSAAGWTADPGVTGIVAGSRPGFIADQTYITSGATQTAVPLAAGTTGNFVVLGWSGGIGSTLQSVETWLAGGDGQEAGWIGESVVGSQTVSAGAPSPVGNIFGAAPQITGFSLGETVPTPEPTSIALGVVGGLSLLAFRRKKA